MVGRFGHWDEEPELVNALAGVIAQQSQLAGGYLVSPDACAPGGAVVAGWSTH